MRLLAALLVLVCIGADAAVAVSGEWQVTLLKGTASVSPVSVGATQDAAWAACQARIPKADTTSTVTSGSVKYTCQTPRYIAFVAYSPNPVAAATVKWLPPTANTDGSVLTDLAGFRIHYGRSATTLSESIDVPDPRATSYALARLASGTWYFAVRAYSKYGDGALSNVVWKVVQ